MKRSGVTLCIMTLLAGTAAAQPLEGDVRVGIGHLGDDSFRYGRYSGVVDQGETVWFDYDARGSAWEITAREVGRDTQRLGLEFRTGGHRIALEYSELPHYFFDDGLTPFQQTDPNEWRLPADWVVTGNTTDAMSNLATSLAPVSIRTDRTRLDLSWAFPLAKAWEVTADYSRETDKGWRPLGAMVGSNGGNARGAVIPSQVDAVSDTVSIGMTTGSTRGILGFAWLGSWYDNDAAPLIWQNPFGPNSRWAGPTVAWPTGEGRIAALPDNEAYQARAFGTRVLTDQLRGSFELAVGTMRQDDVFLPYTINSTLAAPAPLPRTRLDGRIDTLVLDVKLIATPARALRLTPFFRVDDRNNRTPRAAYQPVDGDSVDQVGPDDALINRPYSYRSARAGVDATWRPGRKARLEAGYEWERIDRDFQEIRASDEHTLRAGVTYPLSDTTTMSAEYTWANRDTDPYVGNRPLVEAHPPGTVGAGEFVNHPRLRKYHLAERQRHRLDLRVDWLASPDTSIGTSAAVGRDDYPDDGFGLGEVTLWSLGFDVVHTPSERFDLTMQVNAERFTQDQSGRSFTFTPGTADDPARNWWLDHADRHVFALVAANWRELVLWRGASVDLSLETGLSRAQSETGSRAGTALAASPLPVAGTDHHYVRLEGTFEPSRAGTISVFATREHYRSDDIRLDGVAVDTAAWMLLLGERSPDYAVTWLGMTWRYRFNGTP